MIWQSINVEKWEWNRTKKQAKDEVEESEKKNRKTNRSMYINVPQSGQLFNCFTFSDGLIESEKRE